MCVGRKRLFLTQDSQTWRTSRPLCNSNSQKKLLKAGAVCCFPHTSFFITASIYSPQLQRREMNPPTRRHRGTHPAAKQLTCYNLHVVFCFCPGSSCKTPPFLHCSGPAAVLRGGGREDPAGKHYTLIKILFKSAAATQNLLSSLRCWVDGVKSSFLTCSDRLAHQLWMN